MTKEYIEREALKEDLKESYERLRAIYDSLTYNEDKQICAGQLTTFTEAILRVKEAPAADVVEVVRCRACKHWKPSGSKTVNPFSDMEYIGGCEFTKYCRRESDFCSYGERKGGAD